MSEPVVRVPRDHPEMGADPLASRFATAFKSARLRYRGIEQTDADVDLLFRVKSDPDDAFNSYAGWPRPFTRTFAREFLKKLEANIITVVIELEPEEHRSRLQAEADPYTSVGLPNEPMPIGIISLRGVFAEDPSPSRIAELGVDLLPEFQSHGYGREAIRWILDWGFDMAGLHRVSLHTFSYNTRAIRAYEFIGFRRCGVEEESVWCAGRWWDHLTYGILDREWARIKEEREKATLTNASA